jgi:ABC-2 type transport system ATP-binding protein
VNAIEVNGLVKSYNGQAVLRDLSFAVPKGSICGFLGTNGAGKTTTLRILMGFARAHAGSARVLGMTSGADAVEINKRIGFVPEIKEAYPFARVFEMAKVTRGFYPNWDHALERRLMEELELPARQWCSRLSKGTSAKLLLLLALCRRPDVMILDEPTDGLDPVAQQQALRLLVGQVTERGMTVFFSTHHLDEVEQVADRIVMLKNGRCALEGPLDSIKERSLRLRFVIDKEPATVPAIVAHFRREGRTLTGFSTDDPRVLANDLATHGLKLVEAEPATLREVFFEQVGVDRARMEEPKQ